MKLLLGRFPATARILIACYGLRFLRCHSHTIQAMIKISATIMYGAIQRNRMNSINIMKPMKAMNSAMEALLINSRHFNAQRRN